ncbi:MAG TPA: phosphoserine phosphatase SerB [Alphaproteobacteria bacterium]|nr:phosphoserine phosphatase SerB [Alphaproteobacteria bacterium]
MDKVVTLVAGPRESLDDGLADRIVAALFAEGAEVAVPDWLAAGRACDVAFSGIGDETAQATVDLALDGRAVDGVVLPAAGRRKKLLIADMDSTIVVGETLDEIAALAGIGERVAAITRRAMNGEIDFAGALRERVGLLRGQPADLLDRVMARLELMPGAKALVATMRAHGAHTLLVSGGFTFFTDRVRNLVGFDHHEGNRLGIEDGRLTGTVGEPIQGREHKLHMLETTARAHGLDLAETLAVGDGANDLPMIRAAGLGVAYHAKPAVRAGARTRIGHADLTALLYLQGYRQKEIVEG